jgi:hypothetical protein
VCVNCPFWTDANVQPFCLAADLLASALPAFASEDRESCAD